MKIHVQIRRFTYYLDMGYNLKILQTSPGIYMALYTESIADQTGHFVDVFVRENVAYGYDVVKTVWRSNVYSRRHFV